RILAAGHLEADRRLRVVVRDARRDEYFLSAYSAEGEELLAPLPIPQAGAAEELERRWGQTPYVLLGQRLPGCAWEHGEDEQFPQAAALGLLSEHLDAATHPVQPQYVRGPGAGQPKLALSPLRLPRS